MCGIPTVYQASTSQFRTLLRPLQPTQSLARRWHLEQYFIYIVDFICFIREPLATGSNRAMKLKSGVAEGINETVLFGGT